MAGLFRRFTDRITRTSEDVEAQTLRDSVQRHGATPCEALVDRGLADVSGVLRAVTLPAGDVTALVAELYDGTGSVSLVFLGRQAIRGIEPGAAIRAHGRVSFRKGSPVIFNPVYVLLPGGRSPQGPA